MKIYDEEGTKIVSENMENFYRNLEIAVGLDFGWT